MTEPTLIEKLSQIEAAKRGDPIPMCLRPAGSDGRELDLDWGTPLSKIAGEAVAALERQSWRPMDTAPVEPYDPDKSYYRFRCLLQTERGHVSEGYAYWRLRAYSEPEIRWNNGSGICKPVAWMPLPEPCLERALQ